MYVFKEPFEKFNFIDLPSWTSKRLELGVALLPKEADRVSKDLALFVLIGHGFQ